MNCSKITTNSWYTPIDKLMLWQGNWSKYDYKMTNTFLRIVYDQLLITADTKIMESFNMRHKMKGIYKDDILILIVNNKNNEIRKIKFQIKSNIAQCFEILGKHFPVVNHNKLQSNRSFTPKYRSIDEVLKNAVERKDTIGALNLPNDFENFMKLCLLDPSFSQMITEAEKVLNKDILKE